MPNSKNLEPIEKAYETQYSDDNSEKTESDSEMGTMETLEEPTTATIASSEPPSEENLEKTVIEIDPVDKNKTLEQKGMKRALIYEFEGVVNAKKTKILLKLII